MSEEQEETHERLSRLMAARADELDLNWIDVARLADISVQTLRAIRRGENHPSRSTKRGLERALQWEARSIDGIYGGGEPTPLRDRETREARTAALHRELNEEREKLRALTEEIADDDVRTAVRMLEALADREAG